MIANEEAISMCPVRDLMQANVLTVRPDTPLDDVARLLWDEQISGVPVIDGSGYPLGFVSASDVVRYHAYGPHYRAPAPENGRLKPDAQRQHVTIRKGVAAARDVMTPATFAVGPATTLGELARFLTTAGVHHALVMERGVLAGIVSAFDIVRKLAEQAPAEAPDLMIASGETDLEC